MHEFLIAELKVTIKLINEACFIRMLNYIIRDMKKQQKKRMKISWKFLYVNREFCLV